MTICVGGVFHTDDQESQLGIDEQIMTLQKQHRDPVERTVVEFHIPGGKIGSDLGAFFAQCDSDEEEDKPQIPISESEMVLRFV